ncbi:hypothetical protein A9Q91_02015 [Candidatus Gracilibacteria bacterium 28_42_T64]|nr:hypothetical protein A9Q91_02015 [Candidatus Gracilibacteria bacterium 28_42_T64]
MIENQTQFSSDSLDLDGRVKRSEVKEIQKLGSLESEALKVTINTQKKLKTFLNNEYRWANENYMKPLQVSDMQNALQITVDNNFGPGNFQALIQFQKDNGLITDGLCGPKTQAVLFGDVEETPVQVVTEKTVFKKKRSIAQQEIPIKKAKVLHSSGKKRSIMDDFSVVEDRSIHMKNEKLSKNQFLAKALLMGEELQKSYGIPKMVVVGQSLLESGDGQSDLSQKGNNVFGMKARGGDDFIQYNSDEYIRGSYRTRFSKFRSFSSMDESFDAYAKLLTSPRYSGAFKFKNNPEEFLHSIKESGYATDPSYVQKVKTRLATYGLSLKG